jgi:hypothetical protein
VIRGSLSRTSQVDPEETRPEPAADEIAADRQLPQRTTDLDLGHAEAIGAPLAVLDAVPKSAGVPSRGEEMRRAGRSVTPCLDVDGSRKNTLPYIQDASGLQKMKCTYDGI